MQIKNLNIQYEYEKEAVFTEASLQLPDTGLWLVTGKNGCGKSTLLQYIYKKVVEDAVSSCDIFEVLQQNKILLTSKDELPLDYYEEDIVRFLAKVNGVVLLEYQPLHQQRTLATYSLGELKMVTFKILHALAFDLILIDEYITNLDVKNLQEVLCYLEELSKTTLILVASNEMFLIEQMKNILVIEDGRIFQNSQS